MARNKGGGSKHKKGKSLGQVETLLLRSEEDREFYAHVLKAYGNGQFGVRLVVSDANAQLTLTPKEYRGRISGRMRKQKRRNFVNKDDFVLISKRDFEEDKVDILHVYRPEAMRKLVKMGHLPDIERVGCGDVKEATTAFEFSDELGEPSDSGDGSEAASHATAGSSALPADAAGQAPVEDDWEVSIDDI